ncbi:ANTH domain-containing protein [Glomus cerebriforme]|uniref:ANTH domain-containing protein n=1 Tax=Glomus cerebriforme TaxID=658196 RepID=A0A397T2D0_9GLOM|nr:ANTH domain-containing protein [Glomus cerebriforme]
MSLNMDKAIRGATKPKRAAPKNKYLDVLIPATDRDVTLETMFMSLDCRLKEPSWTVVFKSLIVVHTLMRRGNNDKVLTHLVRYPGLLNVSGFKDKSTMNGAEQNKNIHSYAIYLEEKVAVYRELKVDFTKVNKEGGGRLRKLTVAKGLLREVKILQRQLETLLNCKFYLDEINNEITLCAFRLLVKDLLALFQSVNEGVINVLDQYIEMSKIDAKDALQIYKKFVKQTEKVVDYLGAAKRVQSLGFDIPNLKHAPISLTISLEDYVNDPDFEINRQQYKLAKEERTKAQKAQKAPPISTKPLENKSSDNKPKNDTIVTTTTTLPISTSSSDEKISTKENPYIDFFASIEQEHTVIFGNQYYQNTGTNSLRTDSLRYSTATNPFLAMQNQEIQSSIMQQNLNQPTFQPISAVQDTNPFRSSIYAQDPTPISQAVVPYQNPFLQSLPSSTNASNPFDSLSSMNSGALFQSQLSQQSSITPSATSTTLDNNPFRSLSMSSGFPSQQTQLAVFSQSMHSQDSSTSSFQSTNSTFSQPSYTGF